MAHARDSQLSLRELIYGTYAYFPTRLTNADRDLLRVIEVKRVLTYSGTNPDRPSVKFVIASQSTPQYRPYYRKTDSRGRPHSTQRKIKHQYDVVLSFHELNVDSPVRYRTGADCAMLFGPQYRAKFDKKGNMLQEDKNVLRGRNADFFFRLEWALQANFNALFGRCWARGPAVKMNPHGWPFLEKHALTVAKFLVDRGIIT